MKKSFFSILLISLMLLNWTCNSRRAVPSRILDVKSGKETTLPDIAGDLKKAKFVLVGEYHDNMESHAAQLAVIKALRESGVPIAIGLEMFRQGSQADLDRWTDGRLPEEDFKKVYYRNWDIPWKQYRDIFVYARENHIPMVGLNIPESVSSKVAKEGMTSLSKQEQAALPNVTCKVEPAYEDFIKRALGAHGHSGLNFTNFCEAQLLWDTSMAVTAVNYQKENPETTMVILAGSGHAWKQGIPRQIAKRSDLPVRAILPALPGSHGSGENTSEEADYVWLLGS